MESLSRRRRFAWIVLTLGSALLSSLALHAGGLAPGISAPAESPAVKPLPPLDATVPPEVESPAVENSVVKVFSTARYPDP